MERRVTFAARRLPAVLLLSASVAAAAPAELLEGFTVALPAGWTSPPRLVVPPVSGAVADRLGPPAIFAVGSAGAVWFGVEPGVLVHATRGDRFRPGVAVADVAVLDGGALLVATSDALGFMASGAAPEGSAPGAPVRSAFQPAVTLPVSEPRLAAGGSGSVYVFGAARGSERNEVFLVGPEPGADGSLAVRSLRKIFSTTERVSAVAGDGAETFVATGRLVVRLSAGSAELAPAFLHPKQDVTGLARTRSGLLFYATASAVGVVAPEGTFEFVRAANPAIRAAGDALYVLLRNSYAVVALDDTGAFRRLLRSAAARKP